MEPRGRDLTDPLDLAAAVVAAVAGSAGWEVPAGLQVRASRTWPPDLPERLDARDVEEAAALGPAGLGVLHERMLRPDQRGAGAHYTPLDVAGRMMAAAAPPAWLADGPRRVWDPSCGGGALLLAAAEALRAAGHRPDAVVAELLFGTDLDPGAVAVTEAGLAWWAARAGAATLPSPGHLGVGDGLTGDPPGPGRFDLVVGNPPFQGQLRGASVRSGADRAALRRRLGDVVGPYTDTAALFLVAGARALAPGGRLAMVQPISVLAARDAAAARQAASAVAPLTGLWVAAEPVFEASVEVCAPMLRRPGPGEPPAGPIDRWAGRAFVPLTPAAADVAQQRGTGAQGDGRTWAHLALEAYGVPDVAYRSRGTLGDLAAGAAAFRDEYYGLVPHVVEAPVPSASVSDEVGPGHAPLVTSGSVDPGRCRWGTRPVRFGGRRFLRPVVDLEAVAAAGGRAAAWVERWAVPKVVVATQTRVGEAAVDETGGWVASTPTVVLVPPADRLWDVAAVVCSPVGTVAALAAGIGTGRAAGTIRHSVSTCAGLPLPVDVDAWRAGAVALRDLDRERFLEAMACAYEVRERAALDTWWRERSPWPG